MDSLISKLQADYSEFRFKNGSKFAFCPPKTIVIGPKEPFSELLILHELSHAILKHYDFKLDINRLKMENAAWDQAKILAKRYEIEINEDFIQDQLDTYRNWLHKKSRCPNCGLTRFQSSDGAYHCPRCENFT